MSKVWVLDRVIQGIPIKKGMIYIEYYHYYAIKNSMIDYFVAHHQGLK